MFGPPGAHIPHLTRHFRIPNILANRLVLNLKTYDQPQLWEQSDQRLTAMSFSSSRMLGNIGAPLDMGQWSRDVDVAERRLPEEHSEGNGLHPLTGDC